MSYKRVNFYELCRLCTCSHPKEKVHIFRDEGKKLQLQQKIQMCFPLVVCETDYLPKIVCSNCVQALEACYNFRQSCVNSEMMLSSHFNNFRYTADFRKDGKVYVKEQPSKKPSEIPTEPVVKCMKVEAPPHPEPPEYPPELPPELPAITNEAAPHSTLMYIDIDQLIELPETTNGAEPPDISEPPNDKTIDIEIDKKLIEKIFRCDTCDKTFKRREHLYQHSKLHTGLRPFSCQHCTKRFSRKEHLLRHITSHSGAKDYACEICKKKFSRSDNLKKHKKTHEKRGPFVCEFCSKTFVIEHYYVAHKLQHDELIKT